MMVRKAINSWFSYLPIGQKIGLGYGITLCVALSGTITGFAIGYHHQQKAIQRKIHVRKELDLLQDTQIRVLHARVHQQQLIPLLNNPKRLQEEYQQILTDRQQLEAEWTALRQFIQTEPAFPHELHSTVLPAFLNKYDAARKEYFQTLEQQIKKIQADPSNWPSHQKALLNLTNSKKALTFDAISDEMAELIDISKQEAQEADRWLQEATLVGQKNAAIGILLSIAVSLVLAIVMNRSIARPIRSLTAIAQRSTKESNFNLQAPISSHDEIGMLATAFNQLIASVHDLLNEQQIANQTLEQKVTARTRELSEKSDHLLQLLDELHHTQVQMIQSEKMSALGQMVAGVAHEINNPVNFIHGNLTHVKTYTQDLIEVVRAYQEHYPNSPESLQDLIDAIDLDFLMQDIDQMMRSMTMGTQRIREIVLSLRNFSRLDEAEYKAVNLHEGIENTLLILQHRFKKAAEIQVIRDYDRIPPVECYAGQLNQVFMNLLANAIDALEEHNQHRASAEIRANPGTIRISTLKVGDHAVAIHIADNGIGMTEETRASLFNPFFTTKPVGKGTGLGLSISYQIVTERHHGKLSCNSAPGEGAEFVIEIPIKQVNNHS